jgi:hypothetical protein
MSEENPLWGAPRIHGELLMLGIEVAQTTVARYRTRRQGPPSQGWKTFLRNYAAGIASIDLFVIRTISFKLLYGLVILRHARRRLVSISVTNNPTAEWIAGQVTDAFPWDEAPHQLIRHRDGAFGPAYIHRIRAMRIRDHPTAPRSPWQNDYSVELVPYMLGFSVQSSAGAIEVPKFSVFLALLGANSALSSRHPLARFQPRSVRASRHQPRCADRRH